MDAASVKALRELLASTGWGDRTRRFGKSLREAGHDPGGLLLVGTPDEEPWHLTAHLDEESRWSGLPSLAPVLVRWQPPVGAPPHLAIGMDRLEQAGKGETVFVIAPDTPPASLLERVADARKDGAVILTLDGGDRELESLAHDALVVPSGERSDGGVVLASGLPPVSFDLVSHLVSVSAGEGPSQLRRGVRARLAQMLDTLSGPRES
ncbi:hypothetical protein acdb102_36220 [Acidothermaceae bacterium B102]|nr:hypothetical protein acdb102_36220 [Acidothermaceae bacterium B102]